MGIKSDALKKSTHGMTVAQMEELRLKQTAGEKIPKIKANVNPSYEINEHEQHLVHVILLIDNWEKGRNKGIPRLQKFYVNEFNIMSQTEKEEGQKHRPQNAFGMYDSIKIIHDPRIVKKSVTKTEKDFEPNKDSESNLENSNPKQLTEMSIEELREKYNYLSGEEVSEDTNIPQLITLITEALAHQ